MYCNDYFGLPSNCISQRLCGVQQRVLGSICHPKHKKMSCLGGRVVCALAGSLRRDWVYRSLEFKGTAHSSKVTNASIESKSNQFIFSNTNSFYILNAFWQCLKPAGVINDFFCTGHSLLFYFHFTLNTWTFTDKPKYLI